MNNEKSNNIGIHLMLIGAFVVIIFLAWRLYEVNSQILEYKTNGISLTKENKFLKDSIAKLEQEKTLAILNIEKKHEEKITQIKEEIIARDTTITALKIKNKDFDSSNARLIETIDVLTKEKKSLEEEDLKIKAEAQTLKDENGALKYENQQLKEQNEKLGK